MTVSKKQSGAGRKRWGGAGLSDTWDDWTDFDFLPNKTTKKVPQQQQQQSNQPARNNNLFGKENNNDDDFLGYVSSQPVFL